MVASDALEAVSAQVANSGGLFGRQRAERRHVQAAVEAVQFVAARQTLGGEGDDALEFDDGRSQ